MTDPPSPMCRRPARAVRITPCRSTSRRSCHCSSVEGVEGGLAQDAGVRDADVEAVPRRDQRLGEGVDGLGGPDVDLDDQPFPAAVAHVPQRGLGVVGVTGERPDPDANPPLRQAHCRRGTDPRRGAGDHGDRLIGHHCASVIVFARCIASDALGGATL